VISFLERLGCLGDQRDREALPATRFHLENASSVTSALKLCRQRGYAGQHSHGDSTRFDNVAEANGMESVRGSPASGVENQERAPKSATRSEGIRRSWRIDLIPVFPANLTVVTFVDAELPSLFNPSAKRSGDR
jgi:hypothetical protein